MSSLRPSPPKRQEVDEPLRTGRSRISRDLTKGLVRGDGLYLIRAAFLQKRASIDQARNSKLEVAAIAILGPQLHNTSPGKGFGTPTLLCYGSPAFARPSTMR